MICFCKTACECICTIILFIIMLCIAFIILYVVGVFLWFLCLVCCYYISHLDTCYYTYCEDRCKKLYKCFCKCKCRNNNRIHMESDSDSDSDSDIENQIELIEIKPETKLSEIIIIQNPGPMPLTMGRQCN